MERLVDAVRHLASARSLDDVVEIVRRTARELTGADGATFVLRDGDRCYYVDEDAIAPLWRGERFPMETCISGWSMLHRQVASIPDVYVDDRIPHEAYRPTFVKSLVMVPIRTADPIGAIGNYWAAEHAATDEEIRLLQALADSTAVALENVLLLEELEQRVEERTAELEAANADLQYFAAGAAHDLKGPLATLLGYVDILRRRHGGALGDDGARVVDAIERGLTGAVDLVSDLLLYARSGSEALALGEVDVEAVLDVTVERLKALVEDHHATVRFDGGATITADAMLLGQLLQNLVANAVLYVPESRPPDVRVSVVPVPEGFELQVADNGPGVPDAEKERILEPFQRGAAGLRRPGSGLGLATCRRIVERHGGRLEVRDGAREDELGEPGAVFVAHFPALPAGASSGAASPLGAAAKP